jgi:predicted RNase H-like HicB family nuclease
VVIVLMGSVDCFGKCGLDACIGGLVDVSETYTAVYERDGDVWLAKIAEEPGVHSRCPSLPEARKNIRDALSQWLKTDSENLHIVDDFRMPAPVRMTREEVQASRTENERTQMMASMTDSRSAMDWAKELDVSLRDPVTVQALNDLGDRYISIDCFCHTITMAEELTRLTVTGDRISSYEGLEKD